MSVSGTQREAGEKWIADFYHLMETFDFGKWTETCLAPDVAFNFTNMPPLKGHEGVLSVFGQLAGGVNRMTHELNDVKVLPDRIMAASTVNYGFINGEETSMKAFGILHKGPEDGKAKRYDIYGDFTPVLHILAALQTKA
ncbi:hypothetical protein CPB85DRAFT_1338733 [Mucidula mucida]|nr:hypothetical protein CPB85DRAFT_1338733 [Mucidula mucida]